MKINKIKRTTANLVIIDIASIAILAITGYSVSATKEDKRFLAGLGAMTGLLLGLGLQHFIVEPKKEKETIVVPIK